MQYLKPRGAGVKFPNVQTKDKCPNITQVRRGTPPLAFTWRKRTPPKRVTRPA